MSGYDTAVRDRQLERAEIDYRAGKLRPYPARITMALDLGGHYGPQVDVACLAREPAVDRWEAGTALPSWEQLRALADLTGHPVMWFFSKPAPGGGIAFICGRGAPGATRLPEDVPRFGESRSDDNLRPLIKDTLW